MHNNQDQNGDTVLHIRLRNCDIGLRELRQCLIDGADVNIRNSQRRTLLLEAAKFSNVGIKVYKLLLMWNANVHDIDSENSTVLHNALKNPHVTIQMVMLFLQQGVDPFRRDSEDLQPLAYVMNSSLPDESKIYVSKLLILSYIVWARNSFEDDYDMVEEFEINRNAHINLEFFVGNVRVELVDFRDRCIKEIYRLYKNKFNFGSPVFDLIKKFCFSVERGDTVLTEFRNRRRIESIENYVSLQTVEYFALRYGDIDAPFILLE